MTIKSLFVFVVAVTVSVPSLFAAKKLQTFDNEEANVDLPSQLELGEWVSQADGILNSSQGVPLWNSDGWIQPIGQETAFDNLGPVGPNAEGIAPTAIKTSVFTGVRIHDWSSWGDVTDATYVTMDVQGSFAGSGGISVLVFGPGGSFWSWGAAATDLAVGANPGDVTEWTTITIPINKPSIQSDEQFPAEPGEEGAGGNWGSWQTFVDDEEMTSTWDSVFQNVRSIQVMGLTPDSLIDNLGFILPDVATLGDFDADNDVDGTDFLKWQRGESPIPLSLSDLSDWKNGFGTVAAVGAAAAVPEPSTFGLAIVVATSLICLGFRTHSSKKVQDVFRNRDV